MKAAFFGNNQRDLDRVYGLGRMQQVRDMADVIPGYVTAENFDSRAAELANVEVIFSTWGMFAMTDEMIAAMPRLKAILYAAGSVKGFALPFLERGIGVSSAVSVNAYFVTGFAVSEILLAAKGFFTGLRGERKVPSPIGDYGAKIGIIGAGNVGRQVMAELRRYNFEMLLYDPFVSEEEAIALGAKKATLEELFAECDVVSNHAPNIPSTVGMLTGAMFRSMKPGAVFINTGRGATVEEDNMVRVLDERRDLTALLDVTYPEPPLPGSRILELPNIYITPHIAGALGNEVVAMADLMIGEYKRLEAGLPLEYGVKLEEYDRLA